MKCWRQLLGNKLWVISKPNLNPVNRKVWGHLDKKSRQVLSNIKSMLICFFDQKGTVHKNLFLLVTQLMLHSRSKFWNVYGRMCERSDLISGGTTQGCSTMTMRQPMLPSWLDGFWPITTWLLPYPPYSPDLAPSDFFLFPELKMKLKGRRFQTLEEIQAESEGVLMNTLREYDFQECFKNWQRRWGRCQASAGDCFEGDAAP